MTYALAYLAISATASALFVFREHLLSGVIRSMFRDPAQLYREDD